MDVTLNETQMTMIYQDPEQGEGENPCWVVFKSGKLQERRVELWFK